MLYNKVLNDSDREFYRPLINKMFQLCPDLMNRKPSRANVQQAFVLDTILKLTTQNSKILSVGCYEDSAYFSLQAMKYNIFGIDPVYNYNLHEYYLNNKTQFDIIFSTSVIEHVENDVQFLDEICKMLICGGYGILTCDFWEDQPKNCNTKFYKKHDLECRLGDILSVNGCKFLDSPNWVGAPDFDWDIYRYSFATMVFSKDK